MADPRKTTSPANVNELLQDRIIRHAIFLERLKTHEVFQVSKLLYNEVLKDIGAILREELMSFDGRPLKPLTASERKRLEKVKKTIQVFADKAEEVLNDRIEQSMIEVGEYEGEWSARTLKQGVEQAVPNFGDLTANAKLKIDFASPPPSLIQSIATKNPFEGAVLKDHVHRIAQNMVSFVSRSVNIGIMSGDSIPQIVRRVTGGKDFYGDFKTLNRQTTALVRTAVTSIANEARHITYRSNDDIIKGIRFVATLDSRTTVQCAVNDGKVFPIDSGPRPPLHFNCRSTTVPVLKSWKELGIDLKEAKEGTRAFKGVAPTKTIGGQVPKSVDYKKYLDAQPRDVQNKILGPGRADIFRRGKLPFEKFIDSMNRPLSLKQLKQLEEQIDD